MTQFNNVSIATLIIIIITFFIKWILNNMYKLIFKVTLFIIYVFFCICLFIFKQFLLQVVF